MKNINLLFLLVSFLLLSSCSSDMKDDESGSILTGQLSVSLKDASGKVVKDAFVVMTGIDAKRLVKMGEGRSDADGMWSPEYTGDVKEGYISVVAPGYEPHKEKFSFDGKTDMKMDITLKPSKSLSILSYNVWKGFTVNDKKPASKQKGMFVEWVKTYAPDIIVFQELCYFTEASLLEFDKTYGHEYACITKESGYPTGITSKYPITEIEKINRDDNPKIYTFHGFTHAKCCGIDIFAIHLSPQKLSERITEMQNIIDEKIKQLPAGSKVLVTGDFNSYNLYDAKAYGKVQFENERTQYHPTVEVDYTATNSLLEAGFKDAFTLFSDGYFKPTIPVSYTEFPSNRGSRYDYIMLSDNLATDCTYSDILREKATTNTFSDHYPNYIRLNIAH